MELFHFQKIQVGNDHNSELSLNLRHRMFMSLHVDVIWGSFDFRFVS